MRLKGKFLFITLALALLFTLYVLSYLQSNNEHYQRVIERLLDRYVTVKRKPLSNTQRELEESIVQIKEAEESATPQGFEDVLKDGVTKTKKLRRKHPPEDGFEPRNLWKRSEYLGNNTALTTFLSEQERRKKHVAKLCLKSADYMNTIYASVSYSNLIFDRPDHLTFCPVYKAASTSWSVNMLQLRGFVQKGKGMKKVQELLKMNFPKLSMGSGPALLKETIRFMIVRHPFERLVSCYRDKFESASKTFYYKLYGEKMVRKYRQISKDFTRDESMNMLLAVRKMVLKGAKRDKSMRGNPYANPVGPTFKEFVQFIAQTIHNDEHWRPYFDHCSVCSIPYDFILKFENLHDESKNYIEFLNRTNQLETRWDNMGSSGVSTGEVSCRYFKELTVNLVEKLLYKYGNDFRLYEYEGDDYIKCASDYEEGMKLSVTLRPLIGSPVRLVEPHK